MSENKHYRTQRLRFTRSGWYRFWMRIATGTVDLRSGVTMPDEYGCLHRDVWVGPFNTASEALHG